MRVPPPQVVGDHNFGQDSRPPHAEAAAKPATTRNSVGAGTRMSIEATLVHVGFQETTAGVHRVIVVEEVDVSETSYP